MFPLIRVTKRMEKTYKKPWITRGIFLVSVKKKNRIYDKFCQAKDPGKEYIMLHETFKNTEIL